MPSKIIKIGQISDPHIGDTEEFVQGIDVRANFLKALHSPSMQNLDLLVLSGDLANENAEPGGYHFIKEQIKDYPATAKRLKQEGTVRVRFTILADGKIEQIEVSESSRYSSLDNSALDAVTKMEKFQPIPKLLEKERWRIEIPIQYKLNAGRS